MQTILHTKLPSHSSYTTTFYSSNVPIRLPTPPLTPQGPSLTLLLTIPSTSSLPPSSSNFRPNAFNTSNFAIAT